MTPEPRWRRYLRFYGHRGVADLDDELRFHVEMRVRDYIARGMTEAEARAATAHRLGDLAGARDTCETIATRRQQKMTRTQIIDTLLQDVRFAVRSLSRQKAWTAVAVLTLALGIGGNSAMFSVVNHLLLNPIPYPDAKRVVVVAQQPSTGKYEGGVSVSLTPMGRVALAWRNNNRSFETLEPYRTNDLTMQRGGAAARVVRSAEVLPSFARFAGQRPILGRLFTEAESRGESNVVLLSEGLWRSQFAAEPNAVGAILTVSEKPFTIIGVMPGEFQLPRSADADIDLWLPLDLPRRDDDGLFVIGRLRRGTTAATAAADLDSVLQREPALASKYARFQTSVTGAGEGLSFRDSIVMLTVAVAAVLLIACANVAHLLLARASTRQREMAIRAALGAGKGRLFRQLFTESMLLSLAGCAFGLVIAWAGLHALVAARPGSLAALSAARMDGMTLLVTTGLCVVTGLAFGLVGIAQAGRQATHEGLKAGSLTSSEGRSRGRGRGLLVITEMALCTMLLIGAALLLRSVMHLQSQNMGFDAQNLYTVQVPLPADRYEATATREAFFGELTARMRRVSGVRGLTRASAGPLSMSFAVGALQIEGTAEPPRGTTGFIPTNGVDPDFFKVIGIPLVQGTTFTDTSASAAQVIVNEGFVRKHWPQQSALGRKLRIVYDGKGDWKTVVGVVGNALTAGLTRNASEPLIYTPGPGPFHPAILVRTTGDARILPVLGGIAMSIDSKLPPPQMNGAELAMRKSIAAQRFTMFLLMIFTIIAVGLAAVGLYGVLAYTVARRTREIGIRIALGASRSNVAGSVMQQGLVLALVGAIVGLVAARWGVKLVGTMLYGVQQNDFVSFSVGALLLFVVAVAACVVPMRRALSVDPLVAMRAD